MPSELQCSCRSNGSYQSHCHRFRLFCCAALAPLPLLAPNAAAGQATLPAVAAPLPTPLRRHPLRGRAPVGRHPPRQRLSHNCHPRCHLPCGLSPNIFRFRALPPALLTCWPLRCRAASTPSTALLAITAAPTALPSAATLLDACCDATRRGVVRISSARRAAACHDAVHCAAIPRPQWPVPS